MKTSLITKFLFCSFFVAALISTGCQPVDQKDLEDGVEDGSGGAVWEKVSSDFHPREEKIQVNYQSFRKLRLDLYGFNGDVRLQYADNLPRNTVQFQFFTVQKDSRNALKGVDMRANGYFLEFYKAGTNDCSMEVEEGEILDMIGSCYVRVIVTVPRREGVEVYNLEQRLQPQSF